VNFTSEVCVSGRLNCKFGDENPTSATYLSPTTVQCISPKHGVGTVPIELTANDFDFTFNEVVFTFQNISHITEVFPKTGSVLGGTVVTIVGTNFVPTDSFKYVLDMKVLIASANIDTDY
jgi:hypothetical protein